MKNRVDQLKMKSIIVPTNAANIRPCESRERAALGQPINAREDEKAINDGRSTEGATIRARFSKTLSKGHAQMVSHGASNKGTSRESRHKIKR